MAGSVRTGIAGWVFEPWRGTFYPEGLVQKKELAHASQQVGTIEINSTFRASPTPASVVNWAAQVPDDFVFSVKGPMLISHIKRLKDVQGPLANFLACGILGLGRKLGPFVWQLPENFKFDADRIETFLKLLPQTADAASALAGRHDDKLGREPVLAPEGMGPVRHAIEVRHESFATPAFVDMLRHYNVAQVIADTAGWPWRDITADFVYGRLQGPATPDAKGYGDGDLDDLARQVDVWADGGTDSTPLLAAPAPKTAGRDVFAYFVHEDKLHAPDNARALKARLKPGSAMPS